jgi:hypothetical protein
MAAQTLGSCRSEQAVWNLRASCLAYLHSDLDTLGVWCPLEACGVGTKTEWYRAILEMMMSLVLLGLGDESSFWC